MKLASKLSFVSQLAASTCAIRVAEAAEKNPWFTTRQVNSLQKIAEEMAMNIAQACQTLHESGIPCDRYHTAMRLAVTASHATLTACNAATEYHAARAMKKWQHAMDPKNPAYVPCEADGKPGGLGTGFSNMARHSDTLMASSLPYPKGDLRLRLVMVAARLTRKTPVIQ
jgi:hypothetical protein